jgi:hypothetical protein
VYQAGFAAFGRYQHARRARAGRPGGAADGGFLLAIKRARRTRTATACAAAGLFLVFSTTWHDYDALAANCELFLLAPQAAAPGCCCRDLTTPARGARRDWRAHLAVGALIGYVGAVQVPGPHLSRRVDRHAGLVAISGARRRSWARAGAAASLAGALVPPALYLAWCAPPATPRRRLLVQVQLLVRRRGPDGAAALARGLRRTLLIGGVAIVPYALGIAAAVGRGDRASWRA